LKKKYDEEKQQWMAEKRELQEQVSPRPASVMSTPSPPRKRKKKALWADGKYALDFDFDPGPIQNEEAKGDGRKLIRYANGLAATQFRNGTKKMKKGDVIYVFYGNGDVAIEFPDGAKGYQYSETKAIELSLPNKTVLYAFPNGQKETHFGNGQKMIEYPNGQVKTIYVNGDYEVRHPSGKVEKCIDGHLILTFESPGDD
jgi:hypothetical protein